MSTAKTDELVGPAAYATGGFTFSTGLATVNYFSLEVKTVGPNLPPCHLEYSLNSPGDGDVTVKVMRHRYERTPSLAAVSGLPAGVDSAGASGQTYDNESAHVHSMAHDHGAVTSGNNTHVGGGTPLDLTGPINISVHTHSFDVPNFTGNTGAGLAHNHAWNNIYQHQHSVTNTQTNEAQSELPNLTDLSGTTFTYLAIE